MTSGKISEVIINLTTQVYKSRSTEDGNMVFSPFSLFTAVGILYQGAEGETAKQLQNFFQLDKKPCAEGTKLIMKELSRIKQLTVSATRVYLDKKYQLKKSFKNVIKGNFFADVELATFSQPETCVKNINAWCSAQTNNKIKNVITPEDIDADASIILVNIIYFKGYWLTKFNRKDTVPKKYYLNTTTEINVDMMCMKGCFKYHCDDRLKSQIVEIPFKNETFSMIIILPDNNYGIASLEKKINKGGLNDVLCQKLPFVDIEVNIPKFKIEAELNMKEVFSDMEVGSVFDDKSVLTDIVQKESLHVRKAVQKALLEITEDGAESATHSTATPKAQMTTRSGRIEPVFLADHPFIFIIQMEFKEETMILMAGRVSNPTV